MPDSYQEYFIPFDKEVLVQLLLKELSSASEEARDSLRTLSKEVEAATVKHYHEVLERLVALYEPINPDRDTLPSLNLGEPKQLEQEKLVLSSLRGILDQANFHALSEETIQHALQHHDPLFKSQVHVRLEDYEYMKFWALGLRRGVTPLEMRQMKSSRLFFQRQVKLPVDRSYCKRVIVAARVRTGRMVFKSYKDIPLDELEHLLPAVGMRLSPSGRAWLYLTLAAGGCVLFANLMALGLYGLRLDFLLLLVLFGGLMAQRAGRDLRRRRDQEALGRALLLAGHATSNNGELLVSLARRAQQEHVKEVLLAHAFRILIRGDGQSAAGSGGHSDAELAGLLSLKVSEWLLQQSQIPVSFKGARALAHLHQLHRQPEDG